jgi:hypothetical protein
MCNNCYVTKSSTCYHYPNQNIWCIWIEYP